VSPSPASTLEVAAVEVELDGGGAAERAVGGDPIVDLPAAPEVQARGDAGDERPDERARHEAGRQRRDQGERRAAGDDRQADDDQHHRPEAPGIASDVGCDEIGLDGQRHGAGGDEAHAPEDEAAIDLHLRMFSCSGPIRYRPRRILAAVPSGPFLPVPSSIGQTT
jgi:hypothetical protein